MGRKISTNDLNYETNKYIYDFQQFETIRSFGDSIFRGKITISEAENDQSNLLKIMVEFNIKSRPRTKEGKVAKRNTFEKCKCFL